MHKAKRLIVAVLLTVLLLSGCSTHKVESVSEAAEETPQSMFVVIERTTYWNVVYHHDTKVMYAVSNGGYNGGTFTLLVDADGNPLLYGGNV